LYKRYRKSILINVSKFRTEEADTDGLFHYVTQEKKVREMKVSTMGRSCLSIRPSVRPYSHKKLLNIYLLHFILVVQKYVKQLGPVRAM
jgi:hypothetical protein